MTASRYLDGRYAADNPDWHEADAPWKAAQVLSLLRRHGLAPRRVVELGCGTGGVIDGVAAGLGVGVDALGLDLSPQAIARAGQRARDGLRFEQGTEPPPGCELLLLIDVIEHLEDPFALLRRVRDRATHHLLHIPLELSAQTVLRGEPLLHARRQVGHLHHYTCGTALALLRDCGYEVLDWRYTAAALDRPRAGLGPLMLRLPRRVLFALAPDFAVRLLGGWSLLVLARARPDTETSP